MADLNKVNRNLIIKRHSMNKLVAQSQMMAREIRIEELKEEIVRCEADIAAQNKIIVEAEFNIKQQQDEIAKEAK